MTYYDNVMRSVGSLWVDMTTEVLKVSKKYKRSHDSYSEAFDVLRLHDEDAAIKLGESNADIDNRDIEIAQLVGFYTGMLYHHVMTMTDEEDNAND
jgi:hypothetical protein